MALSEEQLYSVELARMLLADPRLSIQNVKEKVSAATGTPLRKLLSKSEKKRRTPYIRSLIYFLYGQLGLDYGWIKRMTGRIDHTTVRFGIEQMKAFIDEYNSSSDRPVQLREEPRYIHSAELAQRLVNDPDATPENIEHRLSFETGITQDELRGGRRDSPIVTIRQVRDYVLSERFGFDVQGIARRTGRDYKSVKQGVEKITGYVMKARERKIR